MSGGGDSLESVRRWDHQRSDNIAWRATGDVIAARVCVDCIARARYPITSTNVAIGSNKNDEIAERATGDGIASTTTGDGIATSVCGDGITKKRSPREQLICVDCIARARYPIAPTICGDGIALGDWWRWRSPRRICDGMASRAIGDVIASVATEAHKETYENLQKWTYGSYENL